VVKVTPRPVYPWDSPRAGRYWDRSSVEESFSAPVQIALGSDPASYKMGTASPSWQLGHGVDHSPSSSVEDKEIVELHVYSLPGLSLPVRG